MQSAFSSKYHNYIAAEANVLAVSVEYGIFPDRHIPACYEDSWAAHQRITSHSGRSGPESWPNDHADFDRVFVAGESAGGNITHTLVSRVGKFGLSGVRIVGAVLMHPFFGGTGTVDDQMWLYMRPENEGLQDKRMNPAVEDLKRLGCDRVLVFAAEKDQFFEAGRNYVGELKKSGWAGEAELVESWGCEHCFHIDGNPREGKAEDLLQKFVSFIKQEWVTR